MNKTFQSVFFSTKIVFDWIKIVSKNDPIIDFFLNHINDTLENDFFDKKLNDSLYIIILYEFYRNKYFLENINKNPSLISDVIRSYIHINIDEIYLWESDKLVVLQTTISNCNDFIYLCQNKSPDSIDLHKLENYFDSRFHLRDYLLEKEWLIISNNDKIYYYLSIMKKLWIKEIKKNNMELKMSFFIMKFNKEYNFASNNKLKKNVYINDVIEILESKTNFEDLLFNDKLDISLSNNVIVKITPEERYNIYHHLIQLKWILKLKYNKMDKSLEKDIKTILMKKRKLSN